MPAGAAKPRVNPHSKLIAELQGLVLEKQHQVEALSQTRRALRARAAVAQAAVSHCEALVQLAAALQRRGVPGCQGPERGHKQQQQQQQQEQEGGGEPAAAGESAYQPAGGGAGSSSNAGAPPATTDTPCSGGSTSCSAACGGDGVCSAALAAAADAAATAQEWGAELASLRGALEARGNSRAAGCDSPRVSSASQGPANSGGGGGGGAYSSGGPQGEGAPGPPSLRVHWSPEEAAAGVQGVPACGEGACSLGAFRALILDCLRQFGCILPRLQTAAPDRDSCMLQLDVVRARLLGVSALLTLVCPVVLGEIMLEPLEPGAPPPATGLEPPLPHWLYAVRQAALTPEQEDMAIIMHTNRTARMGTICERRARCRKAIAAGTASPDDDVKLVREMEAINVVDVVTYTVANLVLYDSIMDARQYASFLVACYPFFPPVEAIFHAITVQKQEREEADQRSRAAAARELLLQQQQQLQVQQQQQQDGDGGGMEAGGAMGDGRSRSRPRGHRRQGTAERLPSGGSDSLPPPPVQQQQQQQLQQPQHAAMAGLVLPKAQELFESMRQQQQQLLQLQQQHRELELLKQRQQQRQQELQPQ